ncbi:MAG: hypothetical protein PVH84_09370, partial [Candidatus Aminicenantes bacterium]
MRLREYGFFAVLMCMILAAGYVLNSKQDPSYLQSNAQPTPDGNTDNNDPYPEESRVAQQMDVREELSRKLKLATGVLEKRTS